MPASDLQWQFLPSAGSAPARRYRLRFARTSLESATLRWTGSNGRTCASYRYPSIRMFYLLRQLGAGRFATRRSASPTTGRLRRKARGAFLAWGMPVVVARCARVGPCGRIGPSTQVPTRMPAQPAPRRRHRADRGPRAGTPCAPSGRRAPQAERVEAEEWQAPARPPNKVRSYTATNRPTQGSCVNEALVATMAWVAML